jgi:Flp pilus assembly protein TadB
MLLGRRKGDNQPIPPHPYRDSAFVYAGMGVVIILVATFTVGFLRALGTAVVFFLMATAWTWWGYHKRIRARDAEKAAAAARSTGGNGRGGSTNGSGNGNVRSGRR